MSDHIGEPAAEWEPAARHPYASHPAATVLEAHELSYWSRHGTLAHCTCGVTGTSHAAHLTEMLHRAGLLPDVAPPPPRIGRVRPVTAAEEAEDGRLMTDMLGDPDGPPPETPTARVLAERMQG